jgi:predicted regulator of Ras-like GTPase activity (Roadblock/LC7/MglB family)
MQNFELVASCPEVIGAVVSNNVGALLQSAGEIDAETIGAVLSYSAQSLARAGENMGLGELGRVVVAGAKRTCLITVRHDEILSVYVDSSKPVASFEKKMDDLLQR